MDERKLSMTQVQTIKNISFQTTYVHMSYKATKKMYVFILNDKKTCFDLQKNKDEKKTKYTKYVLQI